MGQCDGLGANPAVAAPPGRADVAAHRRGGRGVGPPINNDTPGALRLWRHCVNGGAIACGVVWKEMKRWQLMKNYSISLSKINIT